MSFYIDGFLKQNLDIAKNVIKKDWDMLFVIDGSEGSGKSVLAMQIAKYCDDNFNLDRIVFNPKMFKQAILNAKPYEAVVYDEAYTGLSSRSTMTLINRTLVSMLAEIRQKNLFVFVVMPCFFDLDKYVALWRSRALLHVYTGKNFERGYFAFFNGKKFYSYANPKPNFHGKFYNNYIVDEKGYREKKSFSLSSREKLDTDKEFKSIIEEELFNRVMKLPQDITHTIKIKILDIPESTYYFKLRQFKEEQDLLPK